MSDEKIRILLADDHALVREGIRRVLEEDPEFEVVAEAVDGEEAVALAREHRPDVAVVDISMPRASGFEVTARLQSEAASTHVLILSMHDDVEYVMRAVRAGARGYLLKDEAGPSQLREAVRAVHSGSSFFTSAVAARLAAARANDGGLAVRRAMVPPSHERGCRWRSYWTSVKLHSRQTSELWRG